ncbi:MAG TPA: cupredoxin domain-containing protein [Thermoanaerobaculia bacterium]|nr:cupredoxin domain-containing protein [Thermoanaerobaculia bacterium]
MQSGLARRFTLHLLVPVFLLGLAVAVGSETPKDEKTGTPVEIRLSEYAIEMPATLPPGPTTFLIQNQGGKQHSFKIEGPGIDVMVEALIKPRTTATLQVALQPGEYKVYCPMGNHAAKGMTRTLMVSGKQ